MFVFLIRLNQFLFLAIIIHDLKIKIIRKYLVLISNHALDKRDLNILVSK